MFQLKYTKNHFNSVQVSSTDRISLFLVTQSHLAIAQIMIKANQQKQIHPAIYLNISSSTHEEELPHPSQQRPQIVATKWQRRPAKKTVRVLRVRQTQPHGITLLMQQSMSPTMYMMEMRAVPPQTMAEPQYIKLRKCSLEGSQHSFRSCMFLVTEATMKTPRLFIMAGTLKGSMSCCTGPWCLGIDILYGYIQGSQYFIWMESQRISQSNSEMIRIQPYFRPLDIREYKVNASGVVKFNYVKPQDIPKAKIPQLHNQPLMIKQILKPTPKIIFEKVIPQIVQPRQQQNSSRLSQSSVSNVSKKLSLVSKGIEQDRKNRSTMNMVANDVEERRSEKVKRYQKTISELFQPQQELVKLPSMPSHISAEPILDPVTCSIFCCQRVSQKDSVINKLQLEPSKAQLPNTAREQEKSISSCQAISKKQDKESSYGCCEEAQDSINSPPLKQKKQAESSKLIRQTDTTLEDTDIPHRVLQSWASILRGESNAEQTASCIAPFVLPQSY